MKIDLLVKSGSDPDISYTVSFHFQEGKLSVYCTCIAGEYTKLCKHKTGLMSGDSSILYNETQKSEFETVQEWVQQTRYPELLSHIKNRENTIESAKRELKKSKLILEKAMRDGMGK